jgi:hypothetical protein
MSLSAPFLKNDRHTNRRTVISGRIYRRGGMIP